MFQIKEFFQWRYQDLINPLFFPFLQPSMEQVLCSYVLCSYTSQVCVILLSTMVYNWSTITPCTLHMSLFLCIQTINTSTSSAAEYSVICTINYSIYRQVFNVRATGEKIICKIFFELVFKLRENNNVPLFSMIYMLSKRNPNDNNSYFLNAFFPLRIKLVKLFHKSELLLRKYLTLNTFLNIVKALF